MRSMQTELFEYFIVFKFNALDFDDDFTVKQNFKNVSTISQFQSNLFASSLRWIQTKSIFSAFRSSSDRQNMKETSATSATSFIKQSNFQEQQETRRKKLKSSFWTFTLRPVLFCSIRLFIDVDLRLFVIDFLFLFHFGILTKSFIVDRK